MPCRVLKALKSCASRVCASSSSSERTTSHRNLVQTQTEEVAGSTCGCFALREKVRFLRWCHFFDSDVSSSGCEISRGG